MAGYQIYTKLKDSLTRKFRNGNRGRTSKETKRQMRSKDWGDHLVREFFKMPGAYSTLDAAVFLDEYAWECAGSTILFPESDILMDMLWRSKMNIEEESLEDFPESFMVSWPKGVKINNFDLPSVLVSWGSFNDREVPFRGFREKYLSAQAERQTNPGFNKDEKGLHIVYGIPGSGPNGESMYYRCSIPRMWVKRILKDSQVFSDIGLYGEGLGVHMLTDEEVEMQWTLARMVLNVLVYTQACPESLVSGWPDKVKERSFVGRDEPKVKPTVIKSPRIKGGEGSSPDAHWRNAHFRSYPQRKDGSRRKGIVFVSGCLVNAEVDPKTVLKVM